MYLKNEKNKWPTVIRSKLKILYNNLLTKTVVTTVLISELVKNNI